MSGILTQAGSPSVFDPQECVSRGHAVQQLAWRMAGCADRVDAVLAALSRLQLEQWQSPAGRAYRTTIALQAASLRRARETLEEAAALVLRHSQNVVVSGQAGF